MTPIKTALHPVLRRVALGFAVIVVLTWTVEILGLPHLFFAESPRFVWPRVLLRTAVVFAVWAWVHLTIKRLVDRLHRLEEFLLICSWCRKVGHQGEWLTTEEYFGSKFDAKTSHGICPVCSEKNFGPIPPAR